jgi:hypothetical protein
MRRSGAVHCVRDLDLTRCWPAAEFPLDALIDFIELIVCNAASITMLIYRFHNGLCPDRKSIIP